MKIGYARVSTKDQNLDLQIDALKQEGCEKIYTETMSGTKSERPILQEMLNGLRAGDIVVVWKLDRLGRSLKHLVELVSKFISEDIGLKSLHDHIDTTNPQGRLIFNIFASLAEFERDLIQERTKAGLNAARARGRLGGMDQPSLTGQMSCEDFLFIKIFYSCAGLTSIFTFSSISLVSVIGKYTFNFSNSLGVKYPSFE